MRWRPIHKAPEWVRSEFYQHYRIVCPKCQQYLSLSKSTVLILCRSREHGRDRGMQLKAFIAKRFEEKWHPGSFRTRPAVVKLYNMRAKRAAAVRRPKLRDVYGFAWERGAEARAYATYPLTEREWMLATAIVF